jgi:hypothetical protein
MAVAAKILSAYKAHYSFPPQGESHMHDCIMDALETGRSVKSDYAGPCASYQRGLNTDTCQRCGNTHFSHI